MSYIPHLVVIAGPTASGKSGLAMSLAHQRPSVILSADSRQVYRAFDIGTAKPSVADRQAIVHHFVDICEPTETLTVADYQRQAQGAIAQIHAKGEQHPFLVGGTGLYLNAVTKGLKIPRVPPHPALRSQFIALGQSYCYALLQQLDPDSTRRIHQNDQVRTLRALEVFYVTGRTISSQQGENPPLYPILYIGLACDAEVLRSRITVRVHQMVEAGLAEEVAHLVETYGSDLPLLKTLGYAEMLPYIAGECVLETAIEQIIQHTCQFAKRQRTWFRKEPRIQWFTAGAPDLLSQVADCVEGFIQNLKPI